jgi:hypothetical protein
VWFEVQDRPETPLTLARKRIYIHHLSVQAGSRRHGIASALLRQVEAEALVGGITTIALDTWAANGSARSFFEACGFTAFNLSRKRGKSVGTQVQHVRTTGDGMAEISHRCWTGNRNKGQIKVTCPHFCPAYHEALTLSLFGCLAIVALLSVTLRSPRRIAAVCLPLAAAVVCTAAALLAGNDVLSIFNLFGLLLVVAVGSNYCLFFERQDPGAPSRERMVASLMLANLCTVIGFGILSFSRFPVLNGIGSTVAIGALLCLLFGAILNAPRLPVATAD